MSSQEDQLEAAVEDVSKIKGDIASRKIALETLRWLAVHGGCDEIRLEAAQSILENQ